MNISLFTRRLFCTHHHRTADYVKRMTAAKDTIEKQTEDIKNLQSKLKQKEKLNQTRNNQVHLMRVRLTEDIQKAQKIWSDAKKQIQKNKSEAVNNFAKGLVVLGNQLNKAKTFEKEQVHSVQLREGFDLTSRLYFSTLQKFNIKSTDIKQNDKLKKGQYQQVGQQKTQKAELKGAVARIVEQGWSIQGKITNLPKIVVYA